MEDGDLFRFNADFSAALYRVKINAIQLRETQEENKKTNEQVLQDRQYQVRSPLLFPPHPLPASPCLLRPSLGSFVVAPPATPCPWQKLGPDHCRQCRRGAAVFNWRVLLSSCQGCGPP